MTYYNDLVKRLRESQSHTMIEASDAIEAQTKRIAELEAALKKILVAGINLEKYEWSFITPDWWEEEIEAVCRVLEKNDV